MPQRQHRAVESSSSVASSAPAPNDFGSNAARARYARTPASIAEGPVPGGYQNLSLNLDGSPRYAKTPGPRYVPTPGTSGGGYRQTPELVPGGYQNASLNLDGTPAVPGGYQNASLNLDGTPKTTRPGYQNPELNFDGTPALVPGGYQNLSLNLDGTPRAAPPSALKRPGSRPRGRRVRWDPSTVFPESRRPGVG